MAPFIPTFFLLFALASARCGDDCDFRYCKPTGDLNTNKAPKFWLRDAGVAIKPHVCAKDFGTYTRNVSIFATDTALIQPKVARNVAVPPFVPINEFTNAGLVKPAFSKQYFSISPIMFPTLPGKVGISREKSEGTQEDNLQDACVKIPITAYNLLNGGGGIQESIRGSTRARDCVAFQVRIPSILLELTWDSGDDFDLRLTEPDGNVIFFGNTKSRGGSLIHDQNVGTCDSLKVGTEQIVWPRGSSSPLRGTYQLAVRHYRNCGGGPTLWNLAVVLDGNLVLFEQDRSSSGSNTQIFSTTFTY